MTFSSYRLPGPIKAAYSIKGYRSHLNSKIHSIYKLL